MPFNQDFNKISNYKFLYNSCIVFNFYLIIQQGFLKNNFNYLLFKNFNDKLMKL